MDSVHARARANILPPRISIDFRNRRTRSRNRRRGLSARLNANARPAERRPVSAINDSALRAEEGGKCGHRDDFPSAMANPVSTESISLAADA